MKYFLDTNVLVAASIATHDGHARALPLLEAVHSRRVEGFVSGHTLLEIYSVLTRMPHSPRISAIQAAVLVAENVIKHFSVVTLTGREYADLVAKLGQSGTIGGTVYDSLHLACAEKSGADRIFTFNLTHFAALAPQLHGKIKSP